MMTSEQRVVLSGRPVVPGEAAGRALVLPGGLSLAMAVDVPTGRITDAHTGHLGESMVGRILVMPTGRGSSNASTALAEAVRLGTAPAAIVLDEVDGILVVGALVAGILFGRTCPIVVSDGASRSIPQDSLVSLGASGALAVER